MKKHLFKRSLAMLLAVLTVLATVPLMAVSTFAVSSGEVTGLTDTGIGLSCSSGDSNFSWTASGKTVKGYIKATKKDLESTLTITNNYQKAMTLKFDYTLVTTGANYIKIDGTQVTAAGSFEKELESYASITVSMKTKRNTLSKETSIEMTNVRMFDKDAKTNVTFEVAQNGNYTVDGVDITSSTVVSHALEVLYNVKATPASGYKFNGWYNTETDELLSTDVEASLNIDSDCKIAPKFISTSMAIYEVGGLYFTELDTAVNYAQANSKTLITLVANAILTGQHTIPSGITLLIPFDDEGTLYTDTPGNYAENSSYPASTPYRTLTMATGSSLTVNGTISVSGKHYTASTSVCCKPVGPYGHIKMENDSNIVLNNGAKLYAWGYITGDGNVIANSGAEVYEYFQIVDWRGASKLMSLYMDLGLIQGDGYKKKVFPFHQYYVQNIEANLTLHSGAKESVLVTITASGNPVTCTIPFIGEGGMFQLGSNGSISKKFDSEKSKLVVDISGTASLNSISLSVSGYNIDSSDFVLPINGNIDINIKSGTTTITEDIAFLPGVVMTIDDGAELKVASGAALYVYDAKTWNSSYANGTNALPYSPTRKNPIHHTNSGISAKIDVNGTMTVEGEVYTTVYEDETDGTIYAANICSGKGTGVFVQTADIGSTEATYQYIQSSDTFDEIPVAPALLHNEIADEDGLYYTFTEEAGTTFYYVQGIWTNEVPVKVSYKYDANGEVAEWQWAAKNSQYTITSAVPTMNGYTFTKWTDGKYTYSAGSTYDITDEDVTLIALWQKNEVTVTFKPNGGTGSDKTQKVTNGSTAALDANTFTRTGYIFVGWNTKDNGTGTAYSDKEALTFNSDITLYAQWKKITYTVIWVNDNGDELDRATYNYGEQEPAYSKGTPTSAYTSKGYTSTFKGWNKATIGERIIYTAEYTSVLNTFTVTWKNYDGSVLKTDTKVDYGTLPSYDGDMPVKQGDAQYSYTFSGWSPEVSEVEGDVTYTAQYTQSTNKYTVIWKNHDGETIQIDYNVPYGEMPRFIFAAPVKQSNDPKYVYTFSGWSPEVSEVEGDVTYTAQFTQHIATYTITFDANGGTGSMTPQSADYGEEIQLNENGFIKEGHDFRGWTTNADGTGSFYYDTDTLTVTGHLTLYAQWTPISFLVYWKNNDGTILAAKTYTYGKQDEPTYTKIPIAANQQENMNYTFDKWVKTVDGATITYTATYTSSVKTFTIIWEDFDGTVLETDTDVPYGTLPEYNGDTPNYNSDPQKYTYEFIGWSPAVVKATNDVTYTASYNFYKEGWWNFEYGTTYYEHGEPKYKSAWAKIDENYYYFDESGYIVKGARRVPYPTELLPQYAPDEEDSRVNKKGQPGYLEECGEYPDDESAIFFFDSTTGVFNLTKTGIYYYDFTTRWVQNGMLIWHAGLVKHNDVYFYFKRTGMVTSGEYYVADTNGLLPAAKYNFDENGHLIKLYGIQVDPYNDVEGTLCYFNNFTKVYDAGLIKLGDDYYYVYPSGEVAKDGVHVVRKTNGLLNGNDNGFYKFDENGKVCKDCNGLISEEGNTYYYVQGERVFAGLIEIDGSYYYVKGDLTLAKGGEFWVTKVNDTGIKSGLKRTFDADGKMVIKNGVELYDAGKNIYVYYENDDMIIAPEGETVDRTLADGRKININEYGVVTFLSVKEGLVFEENGDICYYENGVKVSNKGLVQDDDGNFYYINWTGKAVKNGEFWVTVVNDTGIKSGLKRTFDADGKMVVKNGLELYAHKTSKDGYEYDVYVYYINDDIAINMAETQLSDGRTVYTDADGVVHFKEN